MDVSFSAVILLVWVTEGHLACKKTGYWFVDGDSLTGALHVNLSEFSVF